LTFSRDRYDPVSPQDQETGCGREHFVVGQRTDRMVSRSTAERRAVRRNARYVLTLVVPLFVQPGCAPSLARLAAEDRIQEAVRRCERHVPTRERAACFEMLGDVCAEHVPELASELYDRAGLGLDDPRRRSQRGSWYRQGVAHARHGEYAKAETALAKGGYSPADVSLIIAGDCVDIQPSAACLPHAVDYLQRADYARSDALAIVGFAALHAAVGADRPDVEELGARLLSEAGRDPERLRRGLNQQRCDREVMLHELSRIDHAVDEACFPGLVLWQKEPYEERVVVDYTLEPNSPHGVQRGSVEYSAKGRILTADRAPAVRECFQLAERDYTRVASALDSCGIKDKAEIARRGAARVKAARSFVGNSSDVAPTPSKPQRQP
jgi:hypothetical protein